MLAKQIFGRKLSMKNLFFWLVICASLAKGSFAMEIDGIVRHKQHRPEQRAFLYHWAEMHEDYPYPTDEERKFLHRQTKLTERQIQNWFGNYRKRHWPKNPRAQRNK